MSRFEIYSRPNLKQLPASAADVLISFYEKGTELCDDDLDALARLTGLRRLALYNAKRLTDAGLAKLPTLCPDLEHLTLYAADVTAKGIKHLARLPRLSSISLWTLERVRGLGALAKLPLTHIEVRNCAKFDLATLADCPTLARVDLVSQKVSAAHIAAIAGLPALSRLEVFGYKTDLAKGALTGLSAATGLTRLHLPRPLSAAEVTTVAGLPGLTLAYLCVDDVASLEALAPLSGGPTIRLHFADIEKITDAMLARIPEVLPEVEGLNLDQGQVVNRGQKFGADGLAAIGKLTGLRYLNLYRGGTFKNPAVEPLAALKGLEGLNIHGCYKLTAGVAKTLSAMTSLKRLNTSSIKLSDGALKKLAGLPLEAIYIHDARITDKGAAAIAKCTTLKHVSIEFGKTELNDAGIQALATLPGLTLLDLSIGSVSPETFAALARCPSLRHIRLEGNSNVTRLTDAHLQALSASTSLESLSLGYYMQRDLTDAGVQSLAKIPTIREVRFRFEASGETHAAFAAVGARFEPSEHASFDSYVRSGIWDSAGAR